MKFLQVTTVQKLVSSMRGLPPHFVRTCHSQAGDGQKGRVTPDNSNSKKNGDEASSTNFSVSSPSLGNVSSVEQAETEDATLLSNAKQSTVNPVDRAAVVTEGHQAPAKSDSDVGLSGSEDQGPLSRASGPRGPPVPPDPETCCESGCANCVWIKYAEEVKAYYPNEEQKLQEILDMIEDYNVKMFVKMDLGIK